MQPNAFVAEPGTLYVVATPIGNLRDITLRALDILKSADWIAAEDTRVSASLLTAYGIQARWVSCHEHNEQQAAMTLLGHLQQGQSVALVSDAGTPGLSDPGAGVVRKIREAGLPVVPLPGPSAAATLISVAGMQEGSWRFQGFLPPKPTARRKALQALASENCALLFYESPHRIRECLADLASCLGGERWLVVGRELTKRFETIRRMPLAEATGWIDADENNARGEFVLLVEGASATKEADPALARTILGTLLAELPASQAARLTARITGQKKNALYDLALSMKPEKPD